MEDIIQMTDFVQGLITWGLSHGIRIVLIILGVQLASRFGKAFISRAIKRVVKLTIRNHETETKREDTLITVFTGLLRAVIFVIAVLMVLGELDINIGPLLAGAGIIGLAIGMASRSLVQDYISGIFIILEDQYRVGDLVKIGPIEGKVKDISLRRTIIKDSEGVEHFIPNGQVIITSKKLRK